MEKEIMNLYFFEILKQMKFKKDYLIYALLYGATSLIIPLATQYLVNNLIIAGLWQSTLTFIVIISIGLVFSQVLRYGMVILKEYIEREVFILINSKWKNVRSDSKHYYLESFQSLKTFSKGFTDFIDISLTLFFGMVTVILFHPGFIILPLIILSSLAYLWSDKYNAIKSSISESDEKYKIYKKINLENDLKFTDYLVARHKHHFFIKRNNLVIGIIFVVCQILLIKLGVFFIQTNSLSIGQLVSSEIIISGIFGTLIKFPQTLESLYDFETSITKLTKAQEDKI